VRKPDHAGGRHDLAILRRQVGRPALKPADRLPGCGKPVDAPRALLLVLRDPGGPAPLASPVGHSSLDLSEPEVPPRADRHRAPWARPTAGTRRENPRWGYRRNVGELTGVGISISATSVRKLLVEADLGPAGLRGGLSWRPRESRRRLGRPAGIAISVGVCEYASLTCASCSATTTPSSAAPSTRYSAPRGSR